MPPLRAGFSLATSFMPTYWSFLIVRAMYALGKECYCKIYLDNHSGFQVNLHLLQLLPVSWEIFSLMRHALLCMVFSTWVSGSDVFPDDIYFHPPAIPFGSGLGFVLGGAPSEWR